MIMERNLKVVITGGPGSGKSSLIAALKKKGHLCYEEFSRQLIDDGKKRGMENFFLENPLAFSKGLIEERIAQYIAAHSLPLNHPHPWVFFDRGIPDVIAYLNVMGEKSDSLDLNIKNYPYDRVVFLPPWETIYCKDEQRMENFEQARVLSEALWNTYSKTSFPLFELNKGTLTERVDELEKYLLQ